MISIDAEASRVSQKFATSYPLSEYCAQACCNYWVARGAFPYDVHSPAQREQTVYGFAVPLSVAVELGFPKLLVRRWKLGKATSGVAVPKTSMNKHGNLASWQNNVRRARQVLSMQPEAEACSKESLADDQLGLCVLALDAGHHGASDRCGDDIHVN